LVAFAESPKKKGSANYSLKPVFFKVPKVGLEPT
jgi:hypothetical protein